MRWAALPALLVAAFALVASSSGPALAGGYPGASCPSGNQANIVIPGTGGPGYSAVHLQSGFYALNGFFWPPTTLITCRTVHTPGHPFWRPGGTGCHSGAVPLQIPYELAPDYTTPRSVDWGTFLPAGWYFGGGQDGTWATVCWYPRKPANDGTPAGLPGSTPPAAPAASVSGPAAPAGVPAAPADTSSGAAAGTAPASAGA